MMHMYRTCHRRGEMFVSTQCFWRISLRLAKQLQGGITKSIITICKMQKFQRLHIGPATLPHTSLSRLSLCSWPMSATYVYIYIYPTSSTMLPVKISPFFLGLKNSLLTLQVLAREFPFFDLCRLHFFAFYLLLVISPQSYCFLFLKMNLCFYRRYCFLNCDPLL